MNQSELLLYLKMIADTKGGEAVRAELEQIITKEQEQTALQAAARAELAKTRDAQQDAGTAIQETGKQTEEADINLQGLISSLAGLKSLSQGSLMGVRQLTSGLGSLAKVGSELAPVLAAVGAGVAGWQIGRLIDDMTGFSESMSEVIVGLHRAQKEAAAYHQQLVLIRETSQKLRGDELAARQESVSKIDPVLSSNLSAVRQEASARQALASAQSGQRQADIVSSTAPGADRDLALAKEKLQAEREAAQIAAELAADEKSAAASAMEKAQKQLDDLRITGGRDQMTDDQKKVYDKQLEDLRTVYAAARAVLQRAEQAAQLADIRAKTAESVFKGSAADIATQRTGAQHADTRQALQAQLDAKEAELQRLKRITSGDEKDPAFEQASAAARKEGLEASSAAGALASFEQSRTVNGRRVSRSSREYRDMDARLKAASAKELQEADQARGELQNIVKQLIDRLNASNRDVNDLRGQLKNLN